MSILLFSPDMVHLRFSARKIDPQNARVVVMRECEIRLTVAINIAIAPPSVS